MEILAGATGVTKNVMIYRSDTGLPMTGLAFNTSGLTAYYALQRAAPQAISLITQTVTGSFSSGGFVELDATNAPGLYRLDLPNAAIASGRSTIIFLQGVTSMSPVVLEIGLTAVDNQNSTNGGMSALPATSVSTNGSLLTSGTGTDQISVSGGKLLLQATQSGVTIPTVTTVTNQLTAAAIATGVWTDTTAGDFTTALSIGKSIMNGVTLGTGLTINTVTNQLTAAAIATGVWQDSTAGDFTTASSIGKALYIANVVPGGTGGHMISGSNAGTTTFGAFTVTGTMTAAITGNITGNLSGSVGSVTGLTASDVGAIKTNTDKMVFTVANQLDVNLLSWKGTAPLNLSSSRVVTTVAVINNGVITAASLDSTATAAIATGVWQDTTAGDFTVASSIGKSLFTSGAVPGASGGIFIAGSNAATTVNITGSVSGSIGSVTAAVTVGTINATASSVKKNTALAAFPFVMTDSSTHAVAPGLTITSQVMIDASGSFSSTVHSATEISDGVYVIDLAAADLNGTNITLMFTSAGADPRIITLITQP